MLLTSRNTFSSDISSCSYSSVIWYLLSPQGCCIVPDFSLFNINSKKIWSAVCELYWIGHFSDEVAVLAEVVDILYRIYSWNGGWFDNASQLNHLIGPVTSIISHCTAAILQVIVASRRGYPYRHGGLPDTPRRWSSWCLVSRDHVEDRSSYWKSCCFHHEFYSTNLLWQWFNTLFEVIRINNADILNPKIENRTNLELSLDKLYTQSSRP